MTLGIILGWFVYRDTTPPSIWEEHKKKKKEKKKTKETQRPENTILLFNRDVVFRLLQRKFLRFEYSKILRKRKDPYFDGFDLD